MPLKPSECACLEVTPISTLAVFLFFCLVSISRLPGQSSPENTVSFHSKAEMLAIASRPILEVKIQYQGEIPDQVCSGLQAEAQKLIKSLQSSGFKNEEIRRQDINTVSLLSLSARNRKGEFQAEYTLRIQCRSMKDLLKAVNLLGQPNDFVVNAEIFYEFPLDSIETALTRRAIQKAMDRKAVYELEMKKTLNILKIEEIESPESESFAESNSPHSGKPAMKKWTQTGKNLPEGLYDKPEKAFSKNLNVTCGFK